MVQFSREPVVFEDLGNMDYQAAWTLQEQLLQQNVLIKKDRSNSIAVEPSATTHHLLFVEHPPVYTLGKSGHEENVLISEAERIQRNIGYYKTNRGGDITFHGPGQLVGYPILDLEKFYTDIGRYLRNIEQVVIDTLAVYGISGARSAGETGVWVDPDIKGRERKICAMGVRCSRWITMHGFALNVNTDLSYFGHIVPCGIADKQVTSMAAELGAQVDLEEVKLTVKKCFEQVFNTELITTVRQAL